MKWKFPKFPIAARFRVGISPFELNRIENLYRCTFRLSGARPRSLSVVVAHALQAKTLNAMLPAEMRMPVPSVAYFTSVRLGGETRALETKQSLQ